MCKKTHLSCSCLGKSINIFRNGERKPEKLVSSQYHVCGVAKFSRVKQEISVLPNQRFKMLNQFNIANGYRKVGFGMGSKGNSLAQNLENRSFSKLLIHISAWLFYQVHQQNHEVRPTHSEKHYIFLVSLSQMHEKYCHFTFIVRNSQI